MWDRRSTENPHYLPDSSTGRPERHIFSSVRNSLDWPLKPKLSDIESHHRQVSPSKSTKTEAADQMQYLIYGLLSLGSEIPVPLGVVQ